MNQTRTSNKRIRVFILIIGAGIIIWSLYQERRPQQATAQLEFRMVTGERNGQFQVIMMETADRFFVLDSAFRGVFETNDAEIVSRQENLQLMAAYDNLQYRAGLDILNPVEKKQVRLSRELFNQLQFESPFQASISRQVADSLAGITPE